MHEARWYGLWKRTLSTSPLNENPKYAAFSSYLVGKFVITTVRLSLVLGGGCLSVVCDKKRRKICSSGWGDWS